MVIWTKGSLACAPIIISDKIIELMISIKTGTVDSDGDEL
jgi:hypothetical protein